MWEDQAACKGEDTTAVFYTDTAAARRQARAICAECPVQDPCLETALNAPLWGDHGIWAGTTPRQRREIQWRRRHNREETPT